MSAPPLSLCLVNWNGERHIERALGAARRSRLRFAEILLVDNGSVDRSLDLARARCPEVTVLELGENRGPAAARNAGFRAARHDLILFADNDVALAPDCAERLLAALLARPDALVAMPRVLHAGRPDVIQYEGANCHFLGHMALRHAGLPGHQAPTAVTEVHSVVTCCFLVDRTRWRGGEPFDPSFLFNYEDHDFGVRSRLLGHTLLAVPSATCRHGDGTPGLSFREGRERAPLRMYCLIRNRWRIVLQSYAGRTLLLLAPALLLYEVVQLAGAARKGWLGTWLRAAGWMCANPGATWHRRQTLQRARRTRDRAILTGGPLPFAPGLPVGRVERAVGTWLERICGSYWRLVAPRL